MKRVEVFSDARCGIWINENVDNDKTLLLVCDSYLGAYLIPEFTETFSKVVLIWTDYAEHLTHYVRTYNPDMVILECAERVDKSDVVKVIASKIKATTQK